MEKKTPLYDCHVEAGGKIVPFAGYLLPVQYKAGVNAEHKAVRQQCGLFDVSHMGEIKVTGPDALANLNNLLTNDYTGMDDGQARYSPMCNENGGVVDDLIVYKKAENDYLVVVNAANREKDFNWMVDHKFGDVVMEDVSDEYVQIALQGPNAPEILAKLAAADSIPEGYYTAVFDGKVGDIPCIVSRTGYTGEDGFELYCPAAEGPKLWNMLLEAGKDNGLIPCGLGARDTLRMEAAMPLYGHELNDERTPKQVGLGIFVKMDKEDFIGKKAMEEMGVPTIKRCGLKVTGRGIVREECDLYVGDVKVGVTTSGTKTPQFDYPIAMGIIEKAYGEIGSTVEADVRGRRIECEIIKLPFYKR